MSRIIRSKSRVIPGARVAAEEQAKTILAAARDQARTLLAEAKSEAEKIRATAQTDGAKQGRAEAAALLLNAQSAAKDALKSAQGQMVSLALKAARKLVADLMEDDPTRVRQVVGNLLERSERASRITLHVHPQDVELIAPLQADHAIQIAEDDRLQRGECVLESDLGDLDARFDVQLSALERALREPQD